MTIGNAGFDPERLGRLTPFLRDRYLDTGRLPHAQLLVSRRGEIVHFSSQGLAREGSTRGIDDRSIFRIASMSKPITSIGFMTLVDEGRVALDTPVHHVLPEVAAVGVYVGGGAGAPFVTRKAAEPMRMIDLLRHTSRLTYGFQHRNNVDAAYRTDGVDVDTIARWHDGDDLDCYTWREGHGRVMFDRADASRWLRSPKLPSGGGGLVSTALDYHRFCAMCGNGGELDGVRILGRKTLDLMTANHLPRRSDLSTLSRSMFSEVQNAGAGFGLAFAVTQDVPRSMIPGSTGEFYWGGLFSTSFFVDPVERFHVIFMTQLSPSSTFAIRRELKTLIYSALT